MIVFLFVGDHTTREGQVGEGERQAAQDPGDTETAGPAGSGRPGES